MQPRKRPLREKIVPTGFDVIDAYQRDPTLPNFVAWKRSEQSGEILNFFPGTEGLFSIAPELERFEIDPALLAGALDGDDHDIEKLAFALCERLLERRQLEEEGNSQIQSRKLAISDGLLDYLLITMLEACIANGLPPPFSLFILCRERLGGPNPYWRQRCDQDQRVQEAIWRGASMLLNGHKPTLRAIARDMGVEASTVSRWFPNRDFERRCREVFPYLARSVRMK